MVTAYPSKISDVYDISCCIEDFRAHIFCPQTTQEFARKHHEARLPGQLPSYALSQVDYGHTRHLKDCKEVLGTPMVY